MYARGNFRGRFSGYSRRVADPELSSITSTLTELSKRIEALAASHEKDGKSDVAVDLYEVERSLNASVRRLTKLVNAR
jgi:hypothetical protein